MPAHNVDIVLSDDHYYVALCSCGWSDLPRLGWLTAARDRTYHLHTVDTDPAHHAWQCHYCRDAELGIAAPTQASH
jgi:hypothetical protein